MKEDNWCVYFIRVPNDKRRPTKIGYTSDIARRLTEVQTHNPYEVILDCTIPCEDKTQAQKLERFLHRQLYKKCHIIGEWYYLNGIYLKGILSKFNSCHKSILDSDPVEFKSYKKVTVGNLLKEVKELESNVEELQERIYELEEQLCLSNLY